MNMNLGGDIIQASTDDYFSSGFISPVTSAKAGTLLIALPRRAQHSAQSVKKSVDI